MKKFRRAVISILVVTLMLIPISSVQDNAGFDHIYYDYNDNADNINAQICDECRMGTIRKVCNGIDASQDECLNCDEHGKDSFGKSYCKVSKRYGYTLLVCTNCGSRHSGYHLCHETHTIDGITRVVCPYGGYPR